jgi:NAD(P) transhydrogenase subunit alpha
VKIAILKESRDGEPRVAATPETIKKIKALGADLVVENGAGAASAFTDTAYQDAGATIATDAGAVLADADVVLKVLRPTTDEIAKMKSGAVVAAIMSPFADRAVTDAAAAAGVTTFAMEMMPRITRAQSMDVLSSQSNLAGYKAVIDACAEFHRAFPMMMTAAGTIPAARVFVIGAGVAGLQAIATARRLGAIVSATDVRAAAAEQVQSLGATFVMVESEETEIAETAGGYAKEMSEDYKRKQAELIASHIPKQDVVITTALIPGRPAPVLVTEDHVKSMKPGSVIVDLAVEAGGNCPLSEPGRIVEAHGVKIMGHTNVPGRLPVDASSLYARNLFNFISLLIDTESGALTIDWDDDIIKGTCLTRDGKVIHPALTDS